VNHSQLLKRLDTRWQELLASYAGLSETELGEPGVTGTWSVKDIVAHVTAWEAEALTHLPEILVGRKPPRYSVTHGGIDAFNAQMTERTGDCRWRRSCSAGTTLTAAWSPTSRGCRRLRSPARPGPAGACGSTPTATMRYTRRPFEPGASGARPCSASVRIRSHSLARSGWMAAQSEGPGSRAGTA